MEPVRITREHERVQPQPYPVGEVGMPFYGNPWQHWGPYISERAWGTVREDYSPNGCAWDYFPHDAARSRAYRWNEDGLAGISDDRGRMCFALALWNGQDPILKERLFGLTGPQGNHGEDVKEVYFYLDSTPTHSYMRMLYKYPQAAFPYQQLVEENARRRRQDPEFELLDTGIFADNRYFDIFVEYAKAAPEDILIRIRAVNRGTQPAILHLLPTLWFRNTWSWGIDDRKPVLRHGNANPPVDTYGAQFIALAGSGDADPIQPVGALSEARFNPFAPAGGGAHTIQIIEAQHPILGDYTLNCEAADDLLFTNNDTNMQRLFGAPNATPYVKDAFHEYLVPGNHQAINPARTGTKAAALYTRTIAAGATVTLRLRLTQLSSRDGGGTVGAEVECRDVSLPPSVGTLVEPCLGDRYARGGAPASPFADFNAIFDLRKQEADEYYTAIQFADLDEDQRRVQRQALAGMLWSKQFYHYIVDQWLTR